MNNKVVLLSANTFGKGNEELGETLLETFFTLLKQREEIPKAVFCMNSGVLSLTSQSLVSLQLQDLAAKGTDVFACKTCVDYYDVEDKIVVGEISSMAHFIELASQYEVITIN
ncbi:DsrE family protein [Bacillus massiliigorillae]|uniref:DsrE family protein n=1 Tax=Bacillus massiliigorillae TaxID=1243664 RepID=UPI0003A9C1FB|nr:DsrE family protein [Bacillus massiliigorillae]